jgi:hypothetical protein
MVIGTGAGFLSIVWQVSERSFSDLTAEKGFEVAKYCTSYHRKRMIRGYFLPGLSEDNVNV